MIRFKGKRNFLNFAKMKTLIMSLSFLALFTNPNTYGQQNNLLKESEMKATVIEIVIMKAKVGITDNEFLQAAKSLDKVASSFSGFISRELGKDENGNWIDIVYWTDLNSAQKAAEEVMKSPTCNMFFGMIDEQSMKMYHIDLVHHFNNN